MSGMPPTSEPRIGVPQAIASRTAHGAASAPLGSASRSACWRRSINSGSPGPRRWTRNPGRGSTSAGVTASSSTVVPRSSASAATRSAPPLSSQRPPTENPRQRALTALGRRGERREIQARVVLDRMGAASAASTPGAARPAGPRQHERGGGKVRRSAARLGISSAAARRPILRRAGIAHQSPTVTSTEHRRQSPGASARPCRARSSGCAGASHRAGSRRPRRPAPGRPRSDWTRCQRAVRASAAPLRR